MNEQDKLNDTIMSEMNKALKQRGKVNVLIAGKSGVGKSTLINAVFQGQMAETGQGRPVTLHTREINKEGIPVSIFDTRGLEMEQYAETVASLSAFIKQRSSDPDPMQHIHVAWLCVSEDSRRVEEGESAMGAMLSQQVPVIAVVTKARSDDGFRVKVQELLPTARNVVRVRAIPEIDDDGHRREPRGLKELVDATMEVVPEGQRIAFVAAQKVNFERKVASARKYVYTAAATAMAAGATPIPFSDSFVLIPIQVGMLAGITSAFGLPMTQSFLTGLIASATTGLGATFLGRAIVGGLLKLIPGIGTVTGSVISGTTAATLTTAFGETYIAVLSNLLVHEGSDSITEELVRTRFMEELKRRATGS